jgi:predicted NBD/HSP70 family sugar kinase
LLSGTWAHETFHDLLDEMVRGHKIAKPRLADVLIRLLVGPGRPSQSEIAKGTMLLMPSEIAQDTVSRAIAALCSAELVHAHPPVSDRPGRPYTPLQLGSPQWAMIGVKIIYDDRNRAQKAHILVTELDGTPIPLTGSLQSELKQLTDEVPLIDRPDVVEAIGTRIEEICEQDELRERRILGVGIDVAGHVCDGVVIDGSLVGQADPIPLGKRLSERLDKLGQRMVAAGVIKEPHPFPVMVDNDLHVLGVLEIYQPRFAEMDWMVAGVFDAGVGSAPLIGGRVYRGARGASGEIGHVVVSPTIASDRAGDPLPTASRRRARSTALPGFSDPCHCKKHIHGHLDCYATPVRILGELGETRFSHARFAELADEEAASDEGRTRAAHVFSVAGNALGLAMVSVINLYDPSRILLYLPPPLAQPRAGSNGEQYWKAVEAVVREHAFSDAAEHIQITPKSLPVDERAYLGAKAAAVRVMDSLISHARGRCRCVIPGPRPAAPQAELAEPLENLVSLS